MFVTNVRDVVFDPDSLFSRGTDQMPLWQPTLIVFLLGIVNVIPSLLIATRVETAVEGLSQTAIGVAQGIGVLFGFITVFVLWLIFTGVLHGISALAGAGRGSFRQTFRYTGWGFLPSVLGGVLNAYATWQALRRIPASTPAPELSAELQSITIVQITTGVGMLFIVWQGFIWAFALSHCRGLTLRRSAVVAAVPVFAQLGFSIWGLL